jgi:cell division protein ZapA (FtsZ GTPase activity inhibitor)
MTEVVDIEIFGKTYQVRSDKGPDYARQLAAFVDEKMRSVAERCPPSATPLQVAVLTLLNLAEELHQAKGPAESEELEKKAQELIALIEASLAESPT